MVMYSLNPKVHTAGTPEFPNGLLKVGFWELRLGSPSSATNGKAGHAANATRPAKASSTAL